MLSLRSILLLAQVLLVVGSLSLVLAAVNLFGRALAAGLPAGHLYWIIPVAGAAGVIKAHFVMRKRMRQNIDRLNGASGKFWPWQIYPPQLLIFIFSMILVMFVLKRVLAGSAVGLGLLGGIDVAVAVALFMAATEYRHK